MLIKFWNIISHFEIKSDGAHLKFQYPKWISITTWWNFGCLVIERECFSSAGYWLHKEKFNKSGRHLDLSRTELLIFWFHPIVSPGAGATQLSLCIAGLRNWKRALGPRAHSKNKPKENEKPKLKTEKSEKMKLLNPTNRDAVSLWLRNSLGCWLLQASRMHQGKRHSVPFLLFKWFP